MTADLNKINRPSEPCREGGYLFVLELLARLRRLVYVFCHLCQFSMKIVCEFQ
jgi:hypothetical protein